MMIVDSLKNRKALLAFLLAMAMLFANILATPASAEDKEQLSSSEIREQLNELKDQHENISAEIQQLESQIQENLTEMEAIVAQKNVIDQEIFLLHKQVDNINKMISAYNVLIADKQTELNKAQERLDTLNEQNKERIRTMEEDGALSYWSVLFKANSFADLLDRLNMIEEIAAADQRRLDEMRKAAEKVAQAQAELAVEKKNLEDTKEVLAITEAELQEKRMEADALLAELIAIGEAFEIKLEEGEERQEQLLAEISKTKQDLEDALASESYSRWLEESYSKWIEQSIQESIEESRWLATSVPVYTKPSTGGGNSGAPSSSGWRSPLLESSWVTSPYGMRLHPIYGTYRMHSGVDLQAYMGQTIVAAKSGYVTSASWDPSGGGYYVRIDHGDGFASAYLHMTHFIVSAGDYVNAGQTIGYVGSTGASTGPHLHFSIYYNGSSVNPVDYVNFS